MSSNIQNRIENVTNILQQDTARIQNLPNYLQCTITCTDAYGNTETDVIIIYNSEKENYPRPDDPGPDDPGEE